jgi:hypothetical protein
MLKLSQVQWDNFTGRENAREMSKLQWGRMRYGLIALTFVFTLVLSAISSARPALAAPIDDGVWKKISTPALESAMGSTGGAFSIVEYQGKVFMGGVADPDDTDHYSATVYRQTTEGDWELISPALGAELSTVTHMVEFQGKLYIAVAAGYDGKLQIWTYDGNTNTWSKDAKFTLNDERETYYVSRVLGMEIIGGDRLCATTLDPEKINSLAVMCTNGIHAWTQLPNTGIENTEGTSNFFTNLFTVPGSNGIGIVVDYVADDGLSSAVALYEDVDDYESSWHVPPSADFGPNRVITAAKFYADSNNVFNAALFVSVADGFMGGNVELWEAIVIGSQIGLNEDIGASLHISMYGLDTEEPGVILTGTNSNDMPVIKFSSGGGPDEWRNIGPTAEQVGPEGENPAKYVTALNVQDNGDIYLGLQGNGAANGNGTIWYYDDLDKEDDVPRDHNNEDDAPRYHDHVEESGRHDNISTSNRGTSWIDTFTATSDSPSTREDDTQIALRNGDNSGQAETRDDSNDGDRAHHFLWGLLAVPIIGTLWWSIATWHKRKG